MAIHSSILAWRMPWTEKPGRLQSMKMQRVGHNLVTKPPQCIYVNATLSIHPTLSYPHSPTLPCSQVCSLCLCSCPANRSISTIFLDFIHMHQYMIFVLSQNIFEFGIHHALTVQRPVYREAGDNKISSDLLRSQRDHSQ